MIVIMKTVLIKTKRVLKIRKINNKFKDQQISFNLILILIIIKIQIINRTKVNTLKVDKAMKILIFNNLIEIKSSKNNFNLL